MKRVRQFLAAALVAATITSFGAPTPAVAWETSTHVGLAEQAALAANLDARLRQLGWSGGLFEPLTVPKADAPELLASLAQHSPIHGYTPDARGRQHALGWLLAGSALADATPAWAANHFFDPANGQGWRDTNSVTERALTKLRAQNGPDRGMPAPEWVVSRDNPLELKGFLDQYEKAVKAATPGERGRHMAGALIAAGAMMHVLGDMAVPSRVRGDASAHREQVGNDEIDRGSRFERLAAVAWGRLGVPAASRVVQQASMKAFFTGPEGLADWTSTHWFSSGTLPRSVDVGVMKRESLGPALAASLRRTAPAVPRRLKCVSRCRRIR